MNIEIDGAGSLFYHHVSTDCYHPVLPFIVCQSFRAYVRGYVANERNVPHWPTGRNWKTLSLNIWSQQFKKGNILAPMIAQYLHHFQPILAFGLIQIQLGDSRGWQPFHHFLLSRKGWQQGLKLSQPHQTGPVKLQSFREYQREELSAKCKCKTRILRRRKTFDSIYPSSKC